MTPQAQPVGSRVSKWGEGPVWWNNRLAYVDIEGHAIVSFDPETGREEIRELDQRVGFALPCASGRWIWGGDHGLFMLDPDTGASTPIADPEADKPNNRFNDANISPDGRLFAGTIALDKTPGGAALYRLENRLRCETAFPAVTNSNGIVWSVDGDVCFYIDTPTRKVLRFDYCDQTGCLDDPQTAIDTDPVIDASPDGMCIDTDNRLWIAFCHGACVIQFDPATGEPLQRFDVPCLETTSCCFGGPGLRDLYITTGIHKEKKEEHAGRLFVVKNPGATGCPQVPFKDR